MSVFYLWRCGTVNITYERMNRCYTKPKMIINQYFPQCWLLNESINTKSSVDFLKANVHELIICILKTYRKYFFFMLTPCNLHVSQNNWGPTSIITSFLYYNHKISLYVLKGVDNLILLLKTKAFWGELDNLLWFLK